MENYGEAYKRELERARGESKDIKRVLKSTFDVHKTLERFDRIIADLQNVNAPIVCKSLAQIAPSTYTATMTIGAIDFEIVFFNDSIKVFWRGRDKTPMIYDALSASRLNALARTIIERAVASTLEADSKPARGFGSKVVKFPQV
ncbi:MAG TPA: hypothetical protein VM532_11705 [Burkholderiales bacterium]|nr:hypothetical protein [Burkholderiales bacterium]